MQKNLHKDLRVPGMPHHPCVRALIVVTWLAADSISYTWLAADNILKIILFFKKHLLQDFIIK